LATGDFDLPTTNVAAWPQEPKLLARNLLKDFATIVTPEALLRWHRKLIANKYDGTQRRNPGRLTKNKEIEKLVVRMTKETHPWGYLRIRGALLNLGHEVARTTIANILKRHGIDFHAVPACESSRRTMVVPRSGEPGQGSYADETWAGQMPVRVVTVIAAGDAIRLYRRFHSRSPFSQGYCKTL
jgi:hypothetical protein